MLDRPLFVTRRHPFTVCSLLDARSLLGFFCAFGRLLGVLRAFFAHAVSFFYPLVGLTGYGFRRDHRATLVAGGKTAGWVLLRDPASAE